MIHVFLTLAYLLWTRLDELLQLRWSDVIFEHRLLASPSSSSGFGAQLPPPQQQQQSSEVIQSSGAQGVTLESAALRTLHPSLLSRQHGAEAAAAAVGEHSTAFAPAQAHASQGPARWLASVVITLPWREDSAHRAKSYRLEHQAQRPALGAARTLASWARFCIRHLNEGRPLQPDWYVFPSSTKSHLFSPTFKTPAQKIVDLFRDALVQSGALRLDSSASTSAAGAAAGSGGGQASGGGGGAGGGSGAKTRAKKGSSGGGAGAEISAEEIEAFGPYCIRKGGLLDAIRNAPNYGLSTMSTQEAMWWGGWLTEERYLAFLEADEAGDDLPLAMQYSAPPQGGAQAQAQAQAAAAAAAPSSSKAGTRTRKASAAAAATGPGAAAQPGKKAARMSKKAKAEAEAAQAAAAAAAAEAAKAAASAKGAKGKGRSKGQAAAAAAAAAAKAAPSPAESSASGQTNAGPARARSLKRKPKSESLSSAAGVSPMDAVTSASTPSVPLDSLLQQPPNPSSGAPTGPNGHAYQHPHHPYHQQDSHLMPPPSMHGSASQGPSSTLPPHLPQLGSSSSSSFFNQVLLPPSPELSFPSIQSRSGAPGGRLPLPALGSSDGGKMTSKMSGAGGPGTGKARAARLSATASPAAALHNSGMNNNQSPMLPAASGFSPASSSSSSIASFDLPSGTGQPKRGRGASGRGPAKMGSPLISNSLSSMASPHHSNTGSNLSMQRAGGASSYPSTFSGGSYLTGKPEASVLPPPPPAPTGSTGSASGYGMMPFQGSGQVDASSYSSFGQHDPSASHQSSSYAYPSTQQQQHQQQSGHQQQQSSSSQHGSSASFSGAADHSASSGPAAPAPHYGASSYYGYDHSHTNMQYSNSNSNYYHGSDPSSYASHHGAAASGPQAQGGAEGTTQHYNGVGLARSDSLGSSAFGSMPPSTSTSGAGGNFDASSAYGSASSAPPHYGAPPGGGGPSAPGPYDPFGSANHYQPYPEYDANTSWNPAGGPQPTAAYPMSGSAPISHEPNRSIYGSHTQIPSAWNPSR